MNMKTLSCREHGGTFSVPVKRGRPPTNCDDENRCTAFADPVRRAKAKKRETVIDSLTEAQQGMVAGMAQTARGVSKSRARAAQKPSPVTTTVNPTIPLAHQAKERLEPLGWTVKGRAGKRDDGSWWAEMTAHRDEELLVIMWSTTLHADGEHHIHVDQHYSLWNTDKPLQARTDGMPKPRLPFDPSELSDAELIRVIMNRRVKWWNAIAKSEESATIGAKVQVEYTFNGTDEDYIPENRVIKFVDPQLKQFRAFRVGALLWTEVDY